MQTIQDVGTWTFMGAVTLAAPLGLTTASSGQLSFTEESQSTGLIAHHLPSDSFALGPINVAPMLGGGAAGDFNRDGHQDVFFVTGGGGPDKLFISNGDGTFTDRAAQWQVDVAHLGPGGAAVGDFDGDGWLDIYVCSYGPPGDPPAPGHNILYRNTGQGSFVNVAATAGVDTLHPDIPDGFGAAWGDFDLDGDLDLFVACWAGAGCRLFRNDSDGTFADVTGPAGLHDPGVRGFSPHFVDMNGDHYPELLVAADFGTSRYWINNQGLSFADATASSGTGLDGNGMGQAVGDFDNDGQLDWYVTSIHSLAPIPPDMPGTGNMLYQALGRDLFTERSTKASVNDGGWGWGTVAVDVDHDGLLDLVETNGWPGLNANFQYEWTGEQSYLFRNLGGAFFEEIALASGLEHDLQGRGLINLDYDNDGDQDLIFFANADQLMVFRNNLVGPDTHWLRLFFDTGANPRLAPDGLGTHVKVIAGDLALHRVLSGGCNYLSQSELSVHFGLGAATTVDELRIEWNDGTVTVMHDLAADQTLTIASGLLSDLNGDGHVDVADLLLLLADWGSPSSPADVNQDGTVDVLDLLILLVNWNP